MAGPGELVYWEASREAALTLTPSFVPVDHAVVGLVNDVMIDEEPATAADPVGPRRRRKP
jgi:ethanolamine utilization protein EutN